MATRGFIAAPRVWLSGDEERVYRLGSAAKWTGDTSTKNAAVKIMVKNVWLVIYLAFCTNVKV